MSGHLILSYLKWSFILDKEFSPRFAKEQNFTLQQISAFFTLLKVMLDNIKGKQKFLDWTTSMYGSYSRFPAIVEQKKKKQQMLTENNESPEIFKLKMGPINVFPRLRMLFISF